MTVSDGHGGSSTQPVTFVITGTNDVPVLSSDSISTHVLTKPAT